MTLRRELFAFSATLAVLVGGFFSETLVGGRVLSPADVLLVSKSFEDVRGSSIEPGNRLLIDPVLQFQPWLEFNRACLMAGRLPLWNPKAGSGTPHLANGQSAVFDPFHLIAYLGNLPDAYAAMAAARLWFAGLGMFLLARAWGLGVWGRWFSGLTFPFCGFLVGWLLFPVTNVAIWLPWVLLATERLWVQPGSKAVGWLAIAVGGTLLGGHVQTSAHVLLMAGVYSLWRGWGGDRFRRGVLTWTIGVTLGVGIAAIEVIPLGFYLSKSPVWGDRDRERIPAWVVARPRVLDAVCTALPSVYGSQRRGQPNLARVLGVHNQNESAGGFAGLATLIWLAPLAWSSRKVQPRVGLLVGLTVFGMMGAFQFPPVDNLLRMVPVLNVTDNRRLTLWVAFGLVMLGGIGLDGLANLRLARGWRVWGRAWVVGSIALLGAAWAVDRFEPMIRTRALAHYARAALATPGADPSSYRERAERQVEQTLEFLPITLAFAGVQGLTLAWLMSLIRRERVGINAGRAALVGLTLIDVLGFGFGLNPAINRGEDRPVPRIIERLRAEVGNSGRILGLGAELPPNVLMRYGLADARNYDSVELTRSLDWLEPLYDPKTQSRSSRREITWDRVLENLDRLKEAGVRAVVGPSRPPAGFDRSEPVGSVWVAWLEGRPLVEILGPGTVERSDESPGSVVVQTLSKADSRLIVRQTFDPGWRAEIDGRPTSVLAYRGSFLEVAVPAGRHQITITYDPFEVRWALAASLIGAITAVFALTDFRPFRFTRIVFRRLGRTQALGLESDQ